MPDYKNLKDYELACIMVDYISRVNQLEEIIGRYIDDRGIETISAYQIRDLYRQLKGELRENANYLNLVRNYNGSELYMCFFRPSVLEAAASGFSTPVNRAIDQRFFSSVAEARYKLTKYYSFEEWKEQM